MPNKVKASVSLEDFCSSNSKDTYTQLERVLRQRPDSGLRDPARPTHPACPARPAASREPNAAPHITPTSEEEVRPDDCCLPSCSEEVRPDDCCLPSCSIEEVCLGDCFFPACPMF